MKMDDNKKVSKNEKSSIECVITSPIAKTAYSNLRSVSLPALSGVMEVLPGHAESFVLLTVGSIVLRDQNNHIKKISVKEGECHIYQDGIVIIIPH
jgi:F0F1-type ATP synthase epsilon subunit